MRADGWMGFQCLLFLRPLSPGAVRLVLCSLPHTHILHLYLPLSPPQTQGSILMGEDEWECSRVLVGRPAIGSELGPGHTPLEAGLYHAVNLKKIIGCARAGTL